MRHPFDPEPTADTKATAAFGLGLLAAVTGPVVGGVVPAIVALILTRQARRDIADGHGWLTGAGRVRWAERLAWVGLGLAVVSLVALTTYLVLRPAGPISQDFPPSVD